MDISEYAIKAAFAYASADNYQGLSGIDPDVIAEECGELVDAIDELHPLLGEDVNSPELDEERRIGVMRDAFVRTFEAGLRVGLESREEAVEITIQLDHEAIAGLVQRALAGD